MVAAYRDGASPLGALVSVHKSRGAGCLVVLGVAMAVLVVAGGAAFFAIGQPGVAAASLALAAATGWVLARRLRRQGPHLVELHEAGLLEVRNRQRTAMTFDEVRAVRSERVRHLPSGLETETHVVEGAGGKRIAFTLVHDRAQDLIAAIEERVVPRLRKAALCAFDAGETVQFGPVALSEAGLHLPAFEGSALLDIEARPPRVVPWSDLREVSLDKGLITFLGESRRVLGGVALAKLPNGLIFVFMARLAIEQEHAVGEAAQSGRAGGRSGFEQAT